MLIGSGFTNTLVAYAVKFVNNAPRIVKQIGEMKMRGYL
jgi:hypothetical protein